MERDKENLKKIAELVVELQGLMGITGLWSIRFKDDLKALSNMMLRNDERIDRIKGICEAILRLLPTDRKDENGHSNTP